MSHNQSPIKIFAAMVVGLVVGAGAGVMFAPRKGSKTRKIILREAKAITNELVKIVSAEANQMQAKLNGLISSANKIEKELHQEIKSLKI